MTQPHTPEPTLSDARGLAVTSVVCGVLGVLVLFFVGSLAALILGVLALRRCSKESKSRRLARVGLALGGIGLVTSTCLAYLFYPSVTSYWLQKRLLEVGIALHNYHGDYDHFPPAAICDRDGKPLLSWRVAILPYLGQEQLYQRFRLEEPWDSPHNRELLDRMPSVYRNPRFPQTVAHLTYMRVFIGKGTLFGLRRSTDIASVLRFKRSGMLMVVEAGEAVPWTKPEELAFTPQGPLPALGGGPESTIFHFLMADGEVYQGSNPPNPDLLRALVSFDRVSVHPSKLGQQATSHSPLLDFLRQAFGF